MTNYGLLRIFFFLVKDPKIRFQSISFAVQEFGEIAIKKSVRVSHADYGPPDEKLKAISTYDGERRLWISISGEEPTEEDFAQEWPKEKQKRVVRQLEVSVDGAINNKGFYESAYIHKVVEKKGVRTRRFWREVQSFDWKQFVKDEGFNKEIDWQMEKDQRGFRENR